MSNRCVVNGCKSFEEEKIFYKNISRHGQAWCPRHLCQADKCGCSGQKKLYSYYNFPKSPGLRRVWNSLLRMPEDYYPSRHYGVCSKHFDISSDGQGAPRRKVPLLNIDRPDSEIQTILSSHVSLTVEKQILLGMSSPPKPAINISLANTAAAAIASVESFDRSSRGDSSVMDENVYPEGLLGPLFNADDARIASGPTFSTPSTRIKYDTMTEEATTVVIRQRVADRGVPETSSLRPVSMPHETPRTPPPPSSADRRRPFSWANESPFKTPPHVGKRSCQKETPDYSTGKLAASFLDSEARVLRHELDITRTRLFSIESRDCQSCDARVRQLTIAERKIRQMESKIKRMQEKRPNPEPVIRTRTEVDLDIDKMPDRRFVALFGIRKDMFCMIFDNLEPVARATPAWRGTAGTVSKEKPTPPSRKSRNEYLHEFLLFLMRLRLKPNEELLALIFGWSIGKVSNVFNTWLNIFSRQMGWIIKMPDPVNCRRLLPPQVASVFPRLRCMIDCTELFIQSPQSTTDQVATYSQYKKHNTLKILVAILGNGFIAFVSTSWGGRTSDNYIFKNCGLLEMLQSGDQVLADRGFTISDELIRRGVQINIPPAATGVAQFRTEAVVETKRIANVRIHVERAIGRMKNYHILKGVLELTMVPVVDKIFKSVAILVNLQDEMVH